MWNRAVKPGANGRQPTPPSTPCLRTVHIYFLWCFFCGSLSTNESWIQSEISPPKATSGVDNIYNHHGELHGALLLLSEARHVAVYSFEHGHLIIYPESVGARFGLIPRQPIIHSACISREQITETPIRGTTGMVISTDQRNKTKLADLCSSVDRPQHQTHTHTRAHRHALTHTHTYTETHVRDIIISIINKPFLYIFKSKTVAAKFSTLLL